VNFFPTISVLSFLFLTNLPYEPIQTQQTLALGKDKQSAAALAEGLASRR